MLMKPGFVMEIVDPYQIYTNTEEKDEVLRMPYMVRHRGRPNNPMPVPYITPWQILQFIGLCPLPFVVGNSIHITMPNFIMENKCMMQNYFPDQ